MGKEEPEMLYTARSMKGRFLVLATTILTFASCTTMNSIFTWGRQYSIKEFCKNGFGFEYEGPELHSMNLFIKKHGKPLVIVDTPITNRHDMIQDTKSILVYNEYEVCFCNYSKREKWIPPESLLMYVESTPDGKYGNGIRLGDDIVKVRERLRTELGNDDTIEYTNEMGNIVTLQFERRKLRRILWEYGRE
jgi:hypothetical protein